ncbi:hypothetical protein [Deferribacter abyssi]
MSNVVLFNNPEFGQIRIVDQNGNFWFVAKDICEKDIAQVG